MLQSSDAAFPATIFDNEQPVDCTRGFTKREYFAAIALQGLLSADSEMDCSLETYTQRVAAVSVLYADALIEALNNKDQTSKAQ